MSLTASGKSSSCPVPHSPEGALLFQLLTCVKLPTQGRAVRIKHNSTAALTAEPCQAHVSTDVYAHAMALLGTSQKQTLQEVSQIAPKGCEHLARCTNLQQPLQKAKAKKKKKKLVAHLTQRQKSTCESRSFSERVLPSVQAPCPADKQVIASHRKCGKVCSWAGQHPLQLTTQQASPRTQRQGPEALVASGRMHAAGYTIKQ